MIKKQSLEITIKHEFRTLRNFLDYLKDTKLIYYPQNPFEFLSILPGCATLTLHCAPEEEADNIHTIYNKFINGIGINANTERTLPLTNYDGVKKFYFCTKFEIGKTKIETMLNSEFKIEGIDNDLRTKEYLIEIKVIIYDTKKIAIIFDPKEVFLKKEIDLGNYSDLSTLKSLHRRDIFYTDKGDFFLLVGRFVHNENEYIVIPSKQYSYRIVKVPNYKIGDLYYRSGYTYSFKLFGKGLKPTGESTHPWASA